VSGFGCQVSDDSCQKTDVKLSLDEDDFTISKITDLLDLTTAKDDIYSLTRVWISQYIGIWLIFSFLASYLGFLDPKIYQISTKSGC
jgi:hypothetical protein